MDVKIFGSIIYKINKVLNIALRYVPILPKVVISVKSHQIGQGAVEIYSTQFFCGEIF